MGENTVFMYSILPIQTLANMPDGPTQPKAKWMPGLNPSMPPGVNSSRTATDHRLIGKVRGP
jgi:hypothetical protein